MKQADVSRKIMINQVGYYPESTKVAVFSSIPSGSAFSVRNADTDETVFSGEVLKKLETTCGEFSDLRTPGTYYIVADQYGLRSANFKIGDNVLDAAAIDAFKMFYFARCGCKLVDDQIGHEACHTKTFLLNADNTVTDQEVDVTGGWHDAGDYGRYMLTATVIVYDFLHAYRISPSFWGRDDLGIPESGNGVPDILDELRYELDWMLKMQDSESGGVHAQVSGRGVPSPPVEADVAVPNNDVLYVYPITSIATATYAASIAYASEFFKEVDADYSRKLLNSAVAAYNFLKDHPDPINDYIELTNHSQYIVKDDIPARYAATMSLFSVTGEKTYQDDLKSFISQHGIQHGVWCGSQADYANLQYLALNESKTDRTLREQILDGMKKFANSMAKLALQSPYYYCAEDYPWGSNTQAQQRGAFMALVGVETGDDTLIVRGAQQLDFSLGCNAVSTCFMTGYGTIYPHTAHHAPALATMNPQKVKKGMIVNGPYETADGYQDSWWHHYSNEVSLYTNSAFLLNFTVCKENKTDIKVPTGAVPALPKPNRDTEKDSDRQDGIAESETAGTEPTETDGCRSTVPNVVEIVTAGAAAALLFWKKQNKEKQ